MSQPSIRDYLRAVGGANPTGPADAELLARFASSRDESAFELLVWRHAALVQRVCRAVLRDHHAAEDAAQAAFLVLARKAHTFAGRGSVVGWLYRVARRIAVRLAKDRARRPASSSELDRVANAEPLPATPPDETAALCAEVDRLPERYRVPVLLCFFEGLTHAEAARRTGWPIGTVAGRLARAKELLARRLSAKGVGVASVALAMPAGSFVGSTAQAAAAFATRNPVIPGVELSVTCLAEGALKTMTATTWKLSAAVAALVLVTAGAWGITRTEPQAASSSAPVATQATPAATPVPAQAAKPQNADAKQRARSVNNLKQIMLALHNYHDVNSFFPRDLTDKDGKPLLSWRVAILPYIEQDQLYRQFKLDEPWDSENNKKLLADMPEVFKVGIEPKDFTKTYYQGFAGSGTMFEPGKRIRIADIADGTSNTLAVVEAGPPVEWTKPGDISYDPKKDFPKLAGPFDNVLITAFADGSVRLLKRDIDAKNMRNLVERADGNPIDTDTFKAGFPVTKEEIKEAQGLVEQRAKAFGEIAELYREQQKLLEQAAKGNLESIKSLNLERLANDSGGLAQFVEQLKKETEELRKELSGEKKDALPPVIKPAPPIKK